MDGKMITLQVRLKKGKGFPRPAGHQRVYGQATVNGEFRETVQAAFGRGTHEYDPHWTASSGIIEWSLPYGELQALKASLPHIKVHLEWRSGENARSKAADSESLGWFVLDIRHLEPSIASSVNSVARWEKVHGRGKGFGADILVQASCIVSGDSEAAPQAAGSIVSREPAASTSHRTPARPRAGSAKAREQKHEHRQPHHALTRPATPADWSSSGTPPSGDSDGEMPGPDRAGMVSRQGDVSGAPLGLQMDSDAIPIGGRGTDRFSLSVQIDTAAAIANVPAVSRATASGAPLRVWLSYRIFGVLVQSDAFEDPEAPSFRPMRDSFALQASRSDLLRFLRAQPPLPVHLCAPGVILATARLPLAQLLPGTQLATIGGDDAVVNWPRTTAPVGTTDTTDAEVCAVRGSFPLVPPGTPATAAHMLGYCLRGALVLSEPVTPPQIPPASSVPAQASQWQPQAEEQQELHNTAASTSDTPPAAPSTSVSAASSQPAAPQPVVPQPASYQATDDAAQVLAKAAEAATALVEQLGDAARAEADESRRQAEEAAKAVEESQRHAEQASRATDEDDSDTEEAVHVAVPAHSVAAEPATLVEPAAAPPQPQTQIQHPRHPEHDDQEVDEEEEHEEHEEQAYLDDGSVRHFRLSVEVRSVRDVSAAGQMYAKCSLPELGRGAEHELRTRPSIFVPRHAERLLPSPFKAFEFAAPASELADWANRRPLEVEVWRADRFRDDARVGLARIDMGRLLRARPHFRCPQTGATFVSQSMLDQHTRQLRAAASAASSSSSQQDGGRSQERMWDSPAVLVRAADSYSRAIAFAADSQGSSASGGDRRGGEPRVVESCSVRVVLFLEDLGTLDDEEVASGAGVGACLQGKTEARPAPVMMLTAAADEAVAADAMLSGSGAGGQAAASHQAQARRPHATNTSTSATGPADGTHAQYGGSSSGYARGSPPVGRAGEGVRALEARVDAAVAEAVDQAQSDFARWREREEAALAASLRRREAEMRAHLEEEFAQREEERRAELAAARTHVDSMERQLKKAIVAAEKRARDAAAARKEAEREVAAAQREAERESQRSRETAEAIIAVERRKVADALEAVRAERAMREAEAAKRAEAEQRAVDTMARASAGPSQAMQTELATARVRAEAAEARQAELERTLISAQGTGRTARAQALRLAREVQRLREAQRLAAAQEVSKLRVEFLAREQRFAMEGDLAKLRSIRRRVEALRASEDATPSPAQPMHTASDAVEESKSAELPPQSMPATRSYDAGWADADDDDAGAAGAVAAESKAFSSGRISALRAQRAELLQDGYLQDDELVRNLDLLISVAATN